MPCAVVFGESGEKRSYVMLDLDPDEVGKRLREASTFERFELKNGKSVWINPRNVLYIEDRTPGKAAGF